MFRRARSFGRQAITAGRVLWALAAAATAAAGFALALILQTASTARVEHKAEQADAVAQEVSLTGLTLMQAVTAVVASQRGYLLTREPRHLAAYQDARARAVEALSALTPLINLNPVYGREIPVIRTLTEKRLAAADRAVQMARDGQVAAAVAELSADTSLGDTVELRRSVGHLIDTARIGKAAVRAERQALRLHALVGEAVFAALGVIASVIGLISLSFERDTARRAATIQAGLNAQLVAAVRSAEEANGAKSRFLAAASHDLRQPLHALALYISALERRLDQPEAKEILASMDAAVRSMTRLFTALLDLARLEAGVLKPEPIDFPISELLDDVAAQVIEPGRRGDRRVRVVRTGMMVSSDPDLLEIILRNLATNAVRHSKGADVLMGCRRVGDSVRIAVIDAGPGIPDDEVERLFGAFVRGADAGSTEGVGLGLAIVERMAKLLGHPLAVRSRVGHGTSFCIDAPRVRATAPCPAKAPPVRLEGVPILVADDEALSLDAMRRAFEDAGARVVTAASAQQIADVAEQSFELYVVDLNLGKHDGLQILDSIARRRSRSIAGLVVTGATTADTLGRLKEAGVPWVTKPITAEALTTAARQVLESASVA